MKTFQLLTLLACTTFLISCKDPVINASTYEVMNSSYKNILSSLSNEEKEQFSHAYNTIVFSYQNHVAFRKKGDTREVIQERLEALIDGMNSSQVIEVYNRVGKKRALWDIQKLEKNIINIKDDKKQLGLVTIDQYKLYIEKDGKLDRMYLDMVIHNGSKYKLRKADFLIRIGSSYSDTLAPEKRNIYVIFPEGLEQGKDIFKKVDLGYTSSHSYLPKEPILTEYLASRIGGNDVDINSNIHPTLSDFKKGLKVKKSEYEKKFGTDNISF